MCQYIREFLHFPINLITDTTEFVYDLLFWTSKGIWIIKTDMKTLSYLSDKCRTVFLCTSAYCDDIIP